MASTNFMKIKSGSGAVYAMIRHCDKEERLNHGHANENIDKNLTPTNEQGSLTYRQTIQKFKDRIAYLDAQPGANKRKDRVEAFMLEVPIPDGYNTSEFAKMVVDVISEKYGQENLMNWYLHRDEVHEYIDDGVMRTSLPHLHILMVPEVDGKLNGKEFSRRANMKDLNNRIDARAMEMNPEIGFLTGGMARKQSVEALKAESKASEKLHDINVQIEEEKKRLNVLEDAKPKDTSKPAFLRKNKVVVDKDDYQRAIGRASVEKSVDSRIREIDEKQKESEAAIRKQEEQSRQQIDKEMRSNLRALNERIKEIDERERALKKKERYAVIGEAIESQNMREELSPESQAIIAMELNQYDREQERLQQNRNRNIMTII